MSLWPASQYRLSFRHRLRCTPPSSHGFVALPQPGYVNLLLVGLLIFTLWGLLWEAELHGGHRSGCDFRQFYAAGWIVNYGDVSRLYDQSYFGDLQRNWWSEKQAFYSLYPPTLALSVAPLARLPLPAALAVWWTLQAVCLLAAGGILWNLTTIAPRWRTTAMLALACTFPLWLAVRIGHLTPMLLLMLLGGMQQQLRGRRLLAGLVFSLLAIKPQFAAAIGLWLLLRRDGRAVAGMLVGLLLQAVAVSVCLGPTVLADYVHNLPLIAQKVKSVLYSPSYEQSFAGILGRRLYALGYDPRQFGNAFLLTQLVVGATAGWLLWRIVQANRRVPPVGGENPHGPRYECAAAVLLMLLMTPYLLVYDTLTLALPLCCLWSSPRWRMGVVLCAAITLPCMIVYPMLGFSLLPFLELVVLARIAVAAESPVAVAAPQRLRQWAKGIRDLGLEITSEGLATRG
jgi:hypothetical protein